MEISQTSAQGNVEWLSVGNDTLLSISNSNLDKIIPNTLLTHHRMFIAILMRLHYVAWFYIGKDVCVYFPVRLGCFYVSRT